MIRNKKALRDIDSPHYGYLRALYLSFYSPRLYVDVGKRWSGLGIIYLILVFFVLSIPFSVRVIHDFQHFFAMQITEPLLKLPELTIQKGKVSITQPMPYFIKNSDNQVVAIVDTTGKVNKIDGRYPHLSILITQDRLLYRIPNPQFFFTTIPMQQQSPIYQQVFGPEANEIFLGKDLVNSSQMQRINHLALAIIYPTIALIFFSMYVVFALAFSLLAQFVAKLLLKLSLTYQQTCRLLVVASTPQIAFLMFFLTFDFVFPGFGLILLVILAVYFALAIIALRKESNKLVIIS